MFFWYIQIYLSGWNCQCLIIDPVHKHALWVRRLKETALIFIGISVGILYLWVAQWVSNLPFEDSIWRSNRLAGVCCGCSIKVGKCFQVTWTHKPRRQWESWIWEEDPHRSLSCQNSGSVVCLRLYVYHFNSLMLTNPPSLHIPL